MTSRRYAASSKAGVPPAETRSAAAKTDVGFHKGARSSPPPTEYDPYDDEAYRGDQAAATQARRLRRVLSSSGWPRKALAQRFQGKAGMVCSAAIAGFLNELKRPRQVLHGDDSIRIGANGHTGSYTNSVLFVIVRLACAKCASAGPLSSKVNRPAASQRLVDLDLGNTRIGHSRVSLRVEDQALLLGAKRRSSMGVAGSRLAHVKRSFPVRAALVGLLEELPFICPVVVAVGSTVMMVIKLCKDLPQ